jgi:hypothetical protein
MRKGQITDAYVRVMQRSVLGPVSPLTGDACMDCTLHLDADGYPMVWHNLSGCCVKASRVVLAHSLGRLIRPGYCALHKCDRPQCINASHLYEGTLSQNSQDRDTRTGNPCPRGSTHPAAKLVEADVISIRRLIRMGHRKCDIAADFGVSGGVITEIHQGKAWKHVPLDTKVQ